jgi:hypothetical protein
MLASFAGAGKAFVLFHSVQLMGGLFGESGMERMDDRLRGVAADVVAQSHVGR